MRTISNTETRAGIRAFDETLGLVTTMNLAMAERDPDDLFRRFVRARDVRAVGELFDLAAPQLARVAWHLTHDASEVEDLVQATFLTALASTAKFDAERPVMPWLLGILVNHARNARRASAHKPGTLELDVPDARTPEREVEQRELREVVELALADLPDTYRDVVATWLIEGASPGEIARRTGKPPATVRVQLHRGLELLRNSLPAGVAGLLATDAWSQSSSALVREQVIERASEVARTLAPTSAVVAGGVLVGAKLLLGSAAAIAAIGAAVWMAQRDVAEPATLARTVDPIADEVALANEPAVVQLPQAREEVGAAGAKSVSDASAPAPGWWLIGDVPGASASDRAHLSSPTGDDWSADVVGSHFEVAIPTIHDALRKASRGANCFTVRYDSPRFLPIHVQVFVPEGADIDADELRERVELHVAIEPQLATFVATGRVLALPESETSRPFAALCAFDSHEQLIGKPEEAEWCASDGTFWLRSATTGAHALVIARNGWRPATRSFDEGVHGVVDLGDLALDRGEHLAGTVRPPANSAIVMAHASEAEASLDLVPLMRTSRDKLESNLSTSLAWMRDRFEWRHAAVEVEANGVFRLDGLAASTYDLFAEIGDEPSRSSAEISSFTLGSGRPLQSLAASRDDIVLDASKCTVRIDVRSNGVPVDGARVEMSATSGVMSGGLEGHLGDLFWDRQCNLTVRVSKGDLTSIPIVITPEQAAPGALRVIELVRREDFASLVLRPIVTCSPIEGPYSVSLLPVGTDDPAELDRIIGREVRIRDGEWRFDHIPPGRYRVLVGASPPESDDSWCRSPRLEIDLHATEAVSRDLLFEPGGRMAITVHGRNAAPAIVRLEPAMDSAWIDWKFFDVRTGRVERHSSTVVELPMDTRVELTTVFAPGAQDLTIMLRGDRRSTRKRTVQIVAGATTELVVDFDKPDER